jgi:hypothetical protein
MPARCPVACLAHRLLLAWLLLCAGMAAAQSTRPLVQLVLRSPGALTDDTYVYFEAGATAGFDPTFDAVKLTNPSGLNLATVMGGQQYAINGLPPLNGTGLSVPLFIGVPAFGTYRLEVVQLLNLGTVPVWLRDAATNTRLRLATGTSYSLNFTSTYTAVNQLFLEFDAVQAPTATAPAPTVAWSAYPNPSSGHFTLHVPQLAGAEATLRLTDALGRVVRSQGLQLSAAGNAISTVEMAPGLYQLQLVAGGTVLRRPLAVE